MLKVKEVITLRKWVIIYEWTRWHVTEDCSSGNICFLPNKKEQHRVVLN